jgi:hypothetical protein
MPVNDSNPHVRTGLNIVFPHRATHTYTQRIDGTPDEVFPLLCPVRECEWVNGWEPTIVITESGTAERDSVFATGSGVNEAIWVITEYEAPNRIEFVKVTPGETVGRIRILLAPDGDRRTRAEVTYRYTATSERGREAVDAFTAGSYVEFMRAWEADLNHFLRTGSKRPGVRT